MSAKRTSRSANKVERSTTPSKGRADLARLRRASEREIGRSSPPELANLTPEFWASATLVEPVPKQPISLRVDVDVLAWFKKQGPRYQSRMNAVLRAYMSANAAGRRRKRAS